MVNKKGGPILSFRTIGALKGLITGDIRKSPYSSGPMLVRFFNALGYSDTYGPGFPSRGSYVEEKLTELNGTPSINKVVVAAVDPRAFLDSTFIVDDAVDFLNEHLAYDDLSLVRNGRKYELVEFVEDESHVPIGAERDTEEMNFGRLEGLTEMDEAEANDDDTELTDEFTFDAFLAHTFFAPELAEACYQLGKQKGRPREEHVETLIEIFEAGDEDDVAEMFSELLSVVQRSELQSTSKELGLPANLSNIELFNQLTNVVYETEAALDGETSNSASSDEGVAVDCEEPVGTTPEEMPSVVILTALPEEFNAVAEHIDGEDEDEGDDGTVYETGVFTGEKTSWFVAVGETGPGNQAAALAATWAINKYNPDCLMFVGVAGGLKDVVLGDVVVATHVYGYETGKDVEAGILPRQKTMNSSQRLVKRAQFPERSAGLAGLRMEPPRSPMFVQSQPAKRW